jgi:hypothetical protein
MNIHSMLVSDVALCFKSSVWLFSSLETKNLDVDPALRSFTPQAPCACVGIGHAWGKWHCAIGAGLFKTFKRFARA